IFTKPWRRNGGRVAAGGPQLPYLTVVVMDCVQVAEKSHQNIFFRDVPCSCGIPELSLLERSLLPATPESTSWYLPQNGAKRVSVDGLSVPRAPARRTGRQRAHHGRVQSGQRSARRAEAHPHR